MRFTKYFKNRFWSSFWVFVFLIAAVFIVENKRSIAIWIEQAFDFELEQRKEQDLLAKRNSLPFELIPKDNYQGEVIHKSNFLVYYDEKVRNARYTFHELLSWNTRGEASRRGITFNENEKVLSNTADWADFSNTGYDRGHLVPAGDFQCCQEFLEETFAMSNISPFDSVLNRHAWNELEIFTRKTARRFGKVFVFTGPVLKGRHEIGRYNKVDVPSHFFKIIAIPKRNTDEIYRVASFLLPNKPVYDLDKNTFSTSVDEIEKLTGLDFFSNLNKEKEIELESRIDVLDK